MRLEFELDDKGDIIGQLSSDHEQFVKRHFDRGHVAGYGSGAAKAAEDAKKQIERTVAEEKARLERELPFDRERLTKAVETSESLRKQLIDRDSEHDRLVREQEDKHLRAAAERTKVLDAREAKIKALTAAQVRTIASLAGARDESLDELAIIMREYIGYDENMDAFVKGPDGQPLTSAGRPVSVEQYVKQYLDTHPGHKRPTTAKGGQARGGQTVTNGIPADASDFNAAAKRIEDGDRSPEAINALFNARNRRAS